MLDNTTSIKTLSKKFYIGRPSSLVSFHQGPTGLQMIFGCVLLHLKTNNIPRFHLISSNALVMAFMLYGNNIGYVFTNKPLGILPRYCKPFGMNFSFCLIPHNLNEVTL
jgi:hypothetical protein